MSVHENDYDFLCTNDARLIKLAINGEVFHTAKIQTESAKKIDLSGSGGNLDEIVIHHCPKLTRIDWPLQADSIKRVKIYALDDLAMLDVAALKNLEEISVLNCIKLKKIKGLSKSIKQVNLHGVAIKKINIERAKNIEVFNIDSIESNFSIAFKNLKKLRYISIVGNNISCKINTCENLSALNIDARNSILDLEIFSCEKLLVINALHGKDSTLLGVEEKRRYAVINDGKESLNDDQKKKSEMIKALAGQFIETLITLKPGVDDVETIIQKFGSTKDRNQACIVSISLLSTNADKIKEKFAKEFNGIKNTQTVENFLKSNQLLSSSALGLNQLMKIANAKNIKIFTQRNIGRWLNSVDRKKYSVLFLNERDLKNSKIKNMLLKLKRNPGEIKFKGKKFMLKEFQKIIIYKEVVNENMLDETQISKLSNEGKSADEIFGDYMLEQQALLAETYHLANPSGEESSARLIQVKETMQRLMLKIEEIKRIQLKMKNTARSQKYPDVRGSSHQNKHKLVKQRVLGQPTSQSPLLFQPGSQGSDLKKIEERKSINVAIDPAQDYGKENKHRVGGQPLPNDPRLIHPAHDPANLDHIHEPHEIDLSLENAALGMNKVPIAGSPLSSSPGLIDKPVENAYLNNLHQETKINLSLEGELKGEHEPVANKESMEGAPKEGVSGQRIGSDPGLIDHPDNAASLTDVRAERQIKLNLDGEPPNELEAAANEESMEGAPKEGVSGQRIGAEPGLIDHPDNAASLTDVHVERNINLNLEGDLGFEQDSRLKKANKEGVLGRELTSDQALANIGIENQPVLTEINIKLTSELYQAGKEFGESLIEMCQTAKQCVGGNLREIKPILNMENDIASSLKQLKIEHDIYNTQEKKLSLDHSNIQGLLTMGRKLVSNLSELNVICKKNITEQNSNSERLRLVDVLVEAKKNFIKMHSKNLLSNNIFGTGFSAGVNEARIKILNGFIQHLKDNTELGAENMDAGMKELSKDAYLKSIIMQNKDQLKSQLSYKGSILPAKP